MCPTEPRKEPGQGMSSKVRSTSSLKQQQQLGRCGQEGGPAHLPGGGSQKGPLLFPGCPSSHLGAAQSPPTLRPARERGTYCWSRRPRWALVALQPHGSLQGRKAASLTGKGVSKTTVVAGGGGKFSTHNWARESSVSGEASESCWPIFPGQTGGAWVTLQARPWVRSPGKQALPRPPGPTQEEEEAACYEF